MALYSIKSSVQVFKNHALHTCSLSAHGRVVLKQVARVGRGGWIVAGIILPPGNVILITQ